MGKVDWEQLKIAERYADVLQDIRRLEKEIGWNEDAVEMADKYLETLQAIEKLIEEEMSWDEDDVKHAREYLVSLKEIKDSD